MFLSWQDVLARLLSVLLLIAINAFFVTAEFSFVSVRRSRINQLVESGDAPAKIVQKLQRNIDRVLSTTQLGITLSSLALGWIGERAMAVLVADWIARLPLPGNLNRAIAHALAIPIAFLLIAYLQIVLGELCPKSVALIYSEQLARLLGSSSLAIARFFKPFIWILNQSTRFLLRLVGIRYTDEAWLPPVTSEELQLIISTSKESTGLQAEERELLSNVFEFGDVVVSEVMVPRTSIVSISSTATFQELLNEIAKTGHSRYPVTGESLDDVIGAINFIELAEPLAQGRLTLNSQIQPWIRPAKFVPEYTKLSELLPMMQRAPQAIAVVVDEFGGTAGLLTLDDLIAEIIGHTGEPVSSEELIIQKVDEQTFLIQAQINLSEFNELLDLDLPLTDEYQTLGGFLIHQLQKIPNQGEIFHYKNLEFTAIAVKGPRVDQILVRRQKSANTVIVEEFNAANEAENKEMKSIPPDEGIDG